MKTKLEIAKQQFISDVAYYSETYPEMQGNIINAVMSGTQKAIANALSNIDGLLDSLGRQNIVIHQTRDLLLPRLISGQLDVSDLPIDTGGLYA